MKVFTQTFNVLTGEDEWVLQDENYDYYQEIARSAYADMLHDEERNEKYYEGIKRAVKITKNKGKLAKVLDIGTGSGLLSMMAVSSGADSVIACEAFKPVADCAVKVIKENGFEDKIKIIGKRSTELTVGSDGDLPEKANILVTEVFDTELIGEGALETFRHALTNLLEEDSIVVPSSANVYAQVVESDMVSKFSRPSSIAINEQASIQPPKEIVNCRGAPAVHDVQMAQLPRTDLVFVSEPLQVFRFDFTDASSIIFKEKNSKELKILKNGTSQVVFMWWELEMDTSGDIILSCAPPWAHPTPQNMQWRDHWMQAVYYLQHMVDVNVGEPAYLHSYHDQFSLWFEVSKNPLESSSLILESPFCSCSLHCMSSRSRIGMLNDQARNTKYVKMLQKYMTPSTVCLCIGNGSYLPLIAAAMGAKSVFAVDPGLHHCKIVSKYASCNSLEDKITVINKPFKEVELKDLKNEQADIILAEPYFSNMVPLDVLFLWATKTSMKPLLKDNAVSFPQKATIRCIAVEFEDLWRIRAPVVKTQGFTLAAFDEMIQEAISISDPKEEPQPLWEYKNKSLSDSCDLLTVDLSSPLSKTLMESSGKVVFTSEGCCNGVVIWVDFETDGVIVTTGPTESVHPGKLITWDMYTQQTVHFIQHPTVVSTDQNMLYNVKFSPNDGSLNYSFSFS